MSELLFVVQTNTSSVVFRAYSCSLLRDPLLVVLQSRDHVILGIKSSPTGYNCWDRNKNYRPESCSTGVKRLVFVFWFFWFLIYSTYWFGFAAIFTRKLEITTQFFFFFFNTFIIFNIFYYILLYLIYFFRVVSARASNCFLMQIFCE